MSTITKSSFVESLRYSREKCMLFHALNFIAIGLGAVFYFIVLNEFKGEPVILAMGIAIPVFVLLLSFYLVSKHDLTYIEMRLNDGSAIWRDKIEYKISKFAKAIFFQK